MQLKWDYTTHASHYDNRANYADDAISEMLRTAGVGAGDHVADIGAGTGKLTKLLLKNDLKVSAVEPNENMRNYGFKNTKNQNVEWESATAEDTGLPDSVFSLVTFGSSFNVTNRQQALSESKRLLVPGGWFACMWNHRDLNDDIQSEIEKFIHDTIPDYDYGSRRQDQTEEIKRSNLFGPVITVEGKIRWHCSKADHIDAWRSHATLTQQAGEKLSTIIDAIERLLSGVESLVVPYTTRIWMAQSESK